MSVKLSPVVVLSSQLLSDGKEIDIKGPIQLTVPLPYHTHLRASDSLPAWTFDMTTGWRGAFRENIKYCRSIFLHCPCFLYPKRLQTFGSLRLRIIFDWTYSLAPGTWVNKGIGSVRMERNGLVWTYAAPHLGNWIAAPSPTSNGMKIVMYSQMIHKLQHNVCNLHLNKVMTGLFADLEHIAIMFFW